MHSSSRRRVGKALAAAAVTAGCLVVVSAGGAAQAADCPGRVPSDINGDGSADLVIAAPRFRTVASSSPGGPTPGAIEITYGSAEGFSDVSPSQAFTGPPPPAGSAQATIGNGVATGHFDGDCYADLVTDTRVSFTADLLVYSGSPSGVEPAAVRRIESSEVLPFLSADNLGESLAVGDFNDDGFDDVAAGGMEWPDFGSAYGGVGVLYGSDAGLVASTDHWFYQDSPGVPGASEVGDLFGLAVAAGDFTGDGYDDLAVGTPNEDIGAITNAGAVTILKGSALGITGAGSQSWHQGSPGVPGANESEDDLGRSLAAADFDQDGHADLAIGIHGEDIGAATDAGAVLVLRGADDGLTSVGAQSWHQGSIGVPGSNEVGDVFGWALAVADLDANASPDLAIGAQRESIGTVPGAGAITLLVGTPSGLNAAGALSWSQNSPGIPGSAESEDRFGFTLRSLPGSSGAAGVLAIASPFEDVGPIDGLGAVAVLPGGAGAPLPLQTWAWTPNLVAAVGTSPWWGWSLIP